MVKIRIKNIFTLLVLLGFSVGVVGQEASEKKVNPIIEYSVYGGALVKHRETMKDMGNEPYFGNELRLLLQTTGKEYWHKRFNYPAYGVGFYSGYFNNSIIGNPFATYAFMELPFKRGENYYMSTSWGTGVTFHINEFDSVSNPRNIAIGTDMNVFVDFSLFYKYYFSDNLNLGAGLKFQHFSNGAIKYPNLGLNMASFQLVISYLPKKRTKFNQEKMHEPDYKKYEITGFYGLGRNSSQLSEKQYSNTVISLGLSRRFNYKRSFGAGIDISHTPFAEVYVDDPGALNNKDFMSYAGFLSTDLIAGKFRMVVQLGTYFYRSIYFSKSVYERVALRYYFIDNAFFNVSIKAHYAKAQCVEWGVGVTF